MDQAQTSLFDPQDVDKIIAVTAKSVCRDQNELSLDTDFISDLRMDSLEWIDIRLKYGAAFGIDIPETYLSEVEPQTIGKYLDVIYQLKNNPEIQLAYGKIGYKQVIDHVSFTVLGHSPECLQGMSDLGVLMSRPLSQSLLGRGEIDALAKSFSQSFRVDCPFVGGQQTIFDVSAVILNLLGSKGRVKT